MTSLCAEEASDSLELASKGHAVILAHKVGVQCFPSMDASMQCTPQ